MQTATRRPALALASALLLLAACAGPGERTASRHCVAGEPATQATLYFGRALPDGGEVSAADWTAFLDEEVTPRFPDGLTVLDGYGQWRADPATPIAKEHAKVLVIVLFDLEGDRPRLEKVVEAYKARFRQQSVLLTTQPVCAAF